MRRIFAIVLFLVVNLAYADKNVVSFESLEIPLETTSHIDQHSMQLMGYALRVNHGEKMYVGAIYTSQKLKDVKSMIQKEIPMRMRLYILSNKIDPHTSENTWSEELYVNNSETDHEKFANQILSFKKQIKRSFKSGDIIDIEFTPESGMGLYINDTQKSTWPKKDMFNMALKTWIGPHPPTREFKRAILNFPVW